MKKENAIPKTTISIYGKKSCSLAPMIIRKKAKSGKVPDFHDKELEMSCPDYREYKYDRTG